MAWIESHDDLKDHPKTKQLARVLKISVPTAIGHLNCLWWWAMKYAPDGNLSKYKNDDIAEAMLWDGKSVKIVNSLVSCGFLDKEDSCLTIHDWKIYGGKLFEKREREKNRKQNERKTPLEPFDINKPSGGHPQDIQRTSIAREDKRREEKIIKDYKKLPPTPIDGGADSELIDHENVTPTKSDPVPYSEIMALYNSTCTSLPKIQRIDGKRKRAVAARYKTYKGMGAFKVLFEKAEHSEFLRGENDRNWRADFDWIIAPTNMAKVIEGRYDETMRRGPPGYKGAIQAPKNYDDDDEDDILTLMQKERAKREVENGACIKSD